MVYAGDSDEAVVAEASAVAAAALVASMVGLSVILGGVGCGGGLAGASEQGSGVLFRPVLCAVPPYDKFVTSPQPALSAASCGPSSLTAAGMQVAPSKRSPLGYTDQLPEPAIILEGERTTKPAHDAASKVVLLGGLPGSSQYAATSTSKGVRYVLGPAVMTSRAIASATAAKSAGRWFVDWTTTPSSSALWDRIARANFHRPLALDIGGVVVSAPIIEPTQAHFTSFKGRGQVSGDWTQAEATRIASAMESGG